MSDEYAYLFEAKGLQRYILDSGRLVDIIGGSDLIAELCGSDGDDLLGPVLGAAEAGDLALSRRASAAFCLHAKDPDQLDRVRALWRLAVGLTRPGLPFVDVVEKGGSEMSALRAAYRGQSGLRENAAAMLLPVGQPVTGSNRRTGRTAVLRVREGDDIAMLDGVLLPVRRRGRQIARAASEDRLARQFLPAPAEDGPDWRFPRHFEPAEASPDNPAFPFPGDDRRVGVVHADLSGLGQVFRNLTNTADSAAKVLEAAKAIEDAIARAAAAATAEVLLPAAVSHAEAKLFRSLLGLGEKAKLPEKLRIIPARPVVLGGDDLTLLVRADLALPFAKALLTAIERETGAVLPGLGIPGAPDHLTACAGVAIVGAGHPVLAGNTLAEGLCGFAKSEVKAQAGKDEAGRQRLPVSAMAFAVVTATTDTGYDDYRQQELVLGTTEQGEPVVASAAPYRLGDAAGPKVDGLMALARALDAIPGHGKLHEAIAERRMNKAESQKLWRRFREVAAREDQDALDALIKALAAMGSTDEANFDMALPFLNDALEVIDIKALQWVKP